MKAKQVIAAAPAGAAITALFYALIQWGSVVTVAGLTF